MIFQQFLESEIFLLINFLHFTDNSLDFLIQSNLVHLKIILFLDLFNEPFCKFSLNSRKFDFNSPKISSVEYIDLSRLNSLFLSLKKGFSLFVLLNALDQFKTLFFASLRVYCEYQFTIKLSRFY